MVRGKHRGLTSIMDNKERNTKFYIDWQVIRNMAQGNNAPKIQELKDDLMIAVANEEYEKAAVLRDEINALNISQHLFS